MSPSDANRLAAISLASGDATGWFDALYLEAADGRAVVPWQRETPHEALVDRTTAGRCTGRAIVVGAAHGADAEYLAGLGYDTTAFDVSPTAIAAAMHARPHSAVSYVMADLLVLPPDWLGAFDFVFECITVQSLPVSLHPAATDAIVSLLAPGGTLLAVGVAGQPGDPGDDGPPWPLQPAEIDRFAPDTLRTVLRDSPLDGWWRIELQRL